MILKSASSQLKITFRSPSGHLGVILKSACGQFAVPSRVTWSQLEVTSWSARDEVSRASLKAHLEVIPRSGWRWARGHLDVSSMPPWDPPWGQLEVTIRRGRLEASYLEVISRSPGATLPWAHLEVSLKWSWGRLKWSWGQSEAALRWGQLEVCVRSGWGHLVVCARSAGSQIANSKSPWRSARCQLEVTFRSLWSYFVVSFR